MTDIHGHQPRAPTDSRGQPRRIHKKRARSPKALVILLLLITLGAGTYLASRIWPREDPEIRALMGFLGIGPPDPEPHNKGVTTFQLPDARRRRLTRARSALDATDAKRFEAAYDLGSMVGAWSYLVPSWTMLHTQSPQRGAKYEGMMKAIAERIASSAGELGVGLAPDAVQHLLQPWAHPEGLLSLMVGLENGVRAKHSRELAMLYAYVESETNALTRINHYPVNRGIFPSELQKRALTESIHTMRKIANDVGVELKDQAMWRSPDLSSEASRRAAALGLPLLGDVVIVKCFGFPQSP